MSSATRVVVNGLQEQAKIDERERMNKNAPDWIKKEEELLKDHKIPETRIDTLGLGNEVSKYLFYKVLPWMKIPYSIEF